MGRFNEVAVTEATDDHVFIGSPKEFFGSAIVAFIDVLGYRSSIKQDWGNSEAPAARLIHLRDRFDGSASRSVRWSTNTKPPHTYYFRVHTIADAFTLSAAIPREEGAKIGSEDLLTAAITIISNILELWKIVIDQRFSIRGGIELGDVCWDDRTIVGPAQIDAYFLESKVADHSRVILGPELLKRVLDGSRVNPNYNSILALCELHDDGLIAIKELGFDSRLPRLIELSEKAGSNAIKYRGLIARLMRGFPETASVTSADVDAGCQRLKAAIGRAGARAVFSGPAR
jgi:hypothetical protein